LVLLVFGFTGFWFYWFLVLLVFGFTGFFTGFAKMNVIKKAGLHLGRVDVEDDVLDGELGLAPQSDQLLELVVVDAEVQLQVGQDVAPEVALGTLDRLKRAVEQGSMSGLPDFSWRNLPKRKKIYQMTRKNSNWP
jgi:hypothetical protein